LEQFVHIELFGQQYTFQSDTDAAKAKEVAALLTREVTKVQDAQSGQAKYIPNLTILILAALNIANHISELKKDYNEVVGKMAGRYDRLNRMLDEGLQQLPPLRVHG
jgi:cell division protein ZapA